ncbi:hypothetical protein FISHEDRAFT_69153 [Fistulina hepatica ATCC 64428]|uniref:Uncharacterized protein n=1 Tax=Fistulina hepatica ATCC 64428 TaxID=1128425 RepID=A0A0D7AP10_9AGAR|nr:hypothetical protein FISHEDRAFT_69153 [Fistulina hepatica ATCC 64428]
MPHSSPAIDGTESKHSVHTRPSAIDNMRVQTRNKNKTPRSASHDRSSHCGHAGIVHPEAPPEQMRVIGYVAVMGVENVELVLEVYHRILENEAKETVGAPYGEPSAQFAAAGVHGTRHYISPVSIMDKYFLHPVPLTTLNMSVVPLFADVVLIIQKHVN